MPLSLSDIFFYYFDIMKDITLAYPLFLIPLYLCRYLYHN